MPVPILIRYRLVTVTATGKHAVRTNIFRLGRTSPILERQIMLEYTRYENIHLVSLRLALRRWDSLHRCDHQSGPARGRAQQRPRRALHSGPPPCRAHRSLALPRPGSSTTSRSSLPPLEPGAKAGADRTGTRLRGGVILGWLGENNERRFSRFLGSTERPLG